MADIITSSTQMPAVGGNKGLIDALANHGMDDSVMAGIMVDLLQNATTLNAKGMPMDDNVAKVKLLELYYKIKKNTPDIAIQINNTFQRDEF